MQFDLPLVLQIITTLTVVGGFIFGAMNLRQYGHARDEQAALAAVNALAVSSASHMRRVLATPSDRPFKDLVASDRELDVSAGILCGQFEQLGYLVYRRMVPVAIIDDTVGGSIRAVWPKLRPWIEADRVQAGEPVPRGVVRVAVPAARSLPEEEDRPRRLGASRLARLTTAEPSEDLI